MSWPWCKRLGLLGLGVGFLAGGLSGAVEMDVKGVGWRKEKRFERLLRDVLRNPDEPDAPLDLTVMEDAFLLLRSEMIRLGFLYPEIEYKAFEGETLLGEAPLEGGRAFEEVPWGRVSRVVFRIARGERYYFQKVTFAGLEAVDAQEAESFFFPEGSLFVTEGERAYSPAALDGGMASLRRRLAQLGYPEASVALASPPELAPTGEVTVALSVDEGPQFVWGTAQVEGSAPEVAPGRLPPPDPGTVYNDDGLQDWIVAVRNAHFVAGYPNARVSASSLLDPAEAGGEVRVDLTLEVDPGVRTRLGEIRFEGLERTNERFLRSRLDLGPGDWLNRLEVEEAQFDLGRLGIFRRVRQRLEPSGEGPASDLVFAVEERERNEVSALVGYGSYERLRVGLEARATNLFGRAHSAQVRLRQSFRSSAGLLLYNVPSPFPWVESGQVRMQGLLREEVSFTRREALFAVGLERGFFDGALRTSAEYRFELLRSVDLESRDLVGDTRATVGSLLFGLGWDTRDRAIAPREGASAHAQFELASPSLGAEAYYQRFVLRSSLHRSFNHARLRWHFGFEGGVLSRLGADAYELPVNKRFFPGGENSIRGYKEGEASPRDASGAEIGAEIYALGHVEFELRVLESLGVVLFTDGLWSAADLQQTAEGESLVSVGLGLRYSTPLGPLRLEYGHNLNPREFDPSGTVHLSIGFPF